VTNEQLPVEAPLVEQVDAPQVRVRVTQRSPPDQTSDLRMHERGVGVINDQSDPFLKGQVDR
jgi:hypothetical protein